MLRVARLGLCGLVLAGVGTLAPAAQDTTAAQGSTAAQGDQVLTLHAYANLVQTAALVLNQEREPMAPVAPGRFFVSLDGGPPFKVTDARLEGNDPISLAILLDLSQPFPDLMKNIDDAIAGLAPGSLRARDRVQVYALDCDLIRTGDNLPADPATLKRAVGLALEGWRARGRKRLFHCQQPTHLRDALLTIAGALSQQAGHRVILAVTDGLDRGSRSSWNALWIGAQQSSVAMFGLSGAYAATGMPLGEALSEHLFESTCDLSGGMVLTAAPKSLAQQLERFTALLRGRYVVEFPHAVTTTPAYHSMNITIAKSDALIRATGIRVPVDNPKILNDPTTVPMNPADAPQFGKRKVLGPE